MSLKKVALVVLVLSTLLLTLGVGPGVTAAGSALPAAEKPEPLDGAASVLQGLHVASGAPIGRDFPITEASNEQLLPAAAYNSQRQEYLVVWQNEWDAGNNKNLAGQRVSKKGTLIGGPFNIYGGTKGHSPDVAYNSQQDSYLVVWQQDESGWPSVYGAIVSATGQVFPAFEIASGSNILDHSVPAVAYSYTSDKYLVVWQSHWSPMPLQHSIEARFVSNNGVPDPSGSFVISQDSGDGDHRRKPDVAYNRRRNEHLVVWEQRDDITNKYNIHAQRVQGLTGLLLGSPVTISSQPYDELVPAVAAIPAIGSGGQYLVVWQRRWTGTDHDILARRVTGEGNTDGDYFVINSDSQHDTVHPAVAGSEGSREYLVAWTHDYEIQIGPDLFLVWVGIAGRAVSRWGEILGEESYVGGWAADRAAVASGPLGDHLVAFDDEPPGAPTGREIYGHLWGIRVYLPLTLRRH